MQAPRLTDRSMQLDERLRRVRNRARLVPLAWLIALALLLLIALITLGWMLSTWRVNALIMVLPALIPLSLVLAAVAYLDRWEPEPPLLLALMAIYGAGAAVAGTLLTGNFLVDVAENYVTEQLPQAVFSLLVQAPVLEEAMKSLGLLLIVLIARREVGGPLDGFIYAAMIGAGFAFTENIIYFASSESFGTEFMWMLVVRCILSPFAHVLFTGVFGLAIGWAARHHEAWRFVVTGAVGLLAAIGLHALWNGGAVLVLPLLGIEPGNPLSWVIYYLLVQVPLFGVVVWMLMRLQDQDVAVLRRRLDEYRRAGWFTREEVRMITEWKTRRAALHWARKQPPHVAEAMRGFIRSATRLAFAREHAAVDKRDPLRRPLERALLEATRQHREVLNSAQQQRHAGAAQTNVVASKHD